MDGKNNVAGCTSDIDPTTRSVGCFNETSTRKVCACYTNFCNTPIGTISFATLPFSPLTANISAPWDIPFNSNSSTTISPTTIISTTTTISTSTILPSTT
uniref:Uncharacterized protein n=1 Tax=Panagrolaimus sp. PS1159 TaxID=55785 RepID=A0AC35GGC6_9BILA